MKNAEDLADNIRVVKARLTNARTHYKNTRETAHAIKGLKLMRAKQFLQNVIDHKEIVPFKRHTGGIGRHAQCKGTGASQGRWPQKSCNILLGVLRNAEANGESKGLDVSQLMIKHIAVNRAAKCRRRTYRAHGRINPFMSSPCHIEVVLIDKEANEKVDAPVMSTTSMWQGDDM